MNPTLNRGPALPLEAGKHRREREKRSPNTKKKGNKKNEKGGRIRVWVSLVYVSGAEQSLLGCLSDDR